MFLNFTLCIVCSVLNELFVCTAHYIAVCRYNTHCLECTVKSIQCEVFHMHCTVFHMQCLMCCAQCAVCTLHYAMYTVQCSVCSVQCTLPNVQHVVCSGCSAEWCRCLCCPPDSPPRLPAEPAAGAAKNVTKTQHPEEEKTRGRQNMSRCF